MLKVESYRMFLTGDTWHQVVDETGAILGGLGTPEQAANYKAKLERAGITTAEIMLSRIKNPATRAVTRNLMCPTI